MLFSNKASAVLHVLPNSLVWYGKDHKPVTLALPPDTFAYLEVLDEPNAKKLLQEFTQTNAIKNYKVVIILSDDVIFDVALPTDKITDPATRSQEFIDDIPLDPAHRAVISIQQHKTWFVVSTNKHWLHIISQSLRANGNQVTRIAPIGSYSISDNQKLNSKVIDQLLGSNKTAQTFDFLPLLEQ